MSRLELDETSPAAPTVSVDGGTGRRSDGPSVGMPRGPEFSRADTNSSAHRGVPSGEGPIAASGST